MFDTLKKIVGTVAPTLATALGGPLAGTAVKFLGDKFLGNESASTKELEDFFTTASPEHLLELKKADQDFDVKMKELDVDVFRIESSDKKNARKEHKDSFMPAVLSVGLTLTIGLIVYMLFYIEPPQGAREVLFMLLGVIVKEWGGSMQYWFGTTNSSQKKTNLLK